MKDRIFRKSQESPQAELFSGLSRRWRPASLHLLITSRGVQTAWNSPSHVSPSVPTDATDDDLATTRKQQMHTALSQPSLCQWMPAREIPTSRRRGGSSYCFDSVTESVTGAVTQCGTSGRVGGGERSLVGGSLAPAFGIHSRVEFLRTVRFHPAQAACLIQLPGQMQPCARPAPPPPPYLLQPLCSPAFPEEDPQPCT